MTTIASQLHIGLPRIRPWISSAQHTKVVQERSLSKWLLNSKLPSIVNWPETRIADLESSHVCSKVLMLGAGFVTRPTLDILSEAGIPVTVGM